MGQVTMGQGGSTETGLRYHSMALSERQALSSIMSPPWSEDASASDWWGLKAGIEAQYHVELYGARDSGLHGAEEVMVKFALSTKNEPRIVMLQVHAYSGSEGVWEELAAVSIFDADGNAIAEKTKEGEPYLVAGPERAIREFMADGRFRMMAKAAFISLLCESASAAVSPRSAAE